MHAAISIDVDSLHFYRAIHGLAPQTLQDDPIYTIALTRYFELLERCQVPSTLFLIAQDIEPHINILRQGVQKTSSEVANHSFSHDYKMTTWEDDKLYNELSLAHQTLSHLFPDQSIVGFRAPGYNTSEAMLRSIAKLGYTYDSSMLPSFPYFAARALAIGNYWLRKRPSSSLVGQLAAFTGPLKAYNTTPKSPWKQQKAGPLVELPMAVEPLTRFPIIGTSWVIYPEWIKSLFLSRAMSLPGPFIFEMHAIDLLDKSDPGVATALSAVQPDLQIPVSKKMSDFESLFRTMKAHRSVKTMRDIASTVAIA